MAEDGDSFWVSVWKKIWEGVLIAVVLGLLAWVGNLLGLPLWDWVSKWLRASHTLPGWAIAFQFVPLVAILYIVGSVIKFSRSLKLDTKLDETHRLRELRFYELTWRWQYRNEPNDLTVFCPAPGCDMELTGEDVRSQPDGTHFTCRRCGCEVIVPERDYKTIRQTVSLEIDRLFRTGEWKKFITNK